MGVEIMAAISLGFIFGWAGARLQCRRDTKLAYADGVERGLKDMADMAYACCTRCERDGVPRPVELEVERRG